MNENEEQCFICMFGFSTYHDNLCREHNWLWNKSPERDAFFRDHEWRHEWSEYFGEFATRVWTETYFS